MAFALQYEENMHPVGEWFYSDDPFRDLRGDNEPDPRHRWRVLSDGIQVGDIESELNTSSMKGRAGRVHNSKERRSRPITLTFDAWADSTYAFPMIRDFIYHVFDTNEPFYFYEDWRPKDQRPLDVAVNSKRYYVLKEEVEVVKLGPQKARATVELVTAELPYGISTGSTADIIEEGGITFSSGKFGWQEWLNFDEEKYDYRVQMDPGQTVRIYNPSTKKVKHFEACLHIVARNFSNIQSGYGLRITNQTNGTSMKIDREPTAGDSYEQRENIHWVNGLNETVEDPGFIELETGWNELTIEGASALVDFLFHFYY